MYRAGDIDPPPFRGWVGNNNLLSNTRGQVGIDSFNWTVPQSIETGSWLNNQHTWTSLRNPSGIRTLVDPIFAAAAAIPAVAAGNWVYDTIYTESAAKKRHARQTGGNQNSALSSRRTYDRGNNNSGTPKSSNSAKNSGRLGRATNELYRPEQNVHGLGERSQLSRTGERLHSLGAIPSITQRLLSSRRRVQTAKLPSSFSRSNFTGSNGSYKDVPEVYSGSEGPPLHSDIPGTYIPSREANGYDILRPNAVQLNGPGWISYPTAPDATRLGWDRLAANRGSGTNIRPEASQRGSAGTISSGGTGLQTDRRILSSGHNVGGVHKPSNFVAPMNSTTPVTGEWIIAPFIGSASALANERQPFSQDIVYEKFTILPPDGDIPCILTLSDGFNPVPISNEPGVILESLFSPYFLNTQLKMVPGVHGVVPSITPIVYNNSLGIGWDVDSTQYHVDTGIDKVLLWINWRYDVSITFSGTVSSSFPAINWTIGPAIKVYDSIRDIPPPISSYHQMLSETRRVTVNPANLATIKQTGSLSGFVVVDGGTATEIANWDYGSKNIRLQCGIVVKPLATTNLTAVMNLDSYQPTNEPDTDVIPANSLSYKVIGLNPYSGVSTHNIVKNLTKLPSVPQTPLWDVPYIGYTEVSNSGEEQSPRTRLQTEEIREIERHHWEEDPDPSSEEENGSYPSDEETDEITEEISDETEITEEISAASDSSGEDESEREQRPGKCTCCDWEE